MSWSSQGQGHSKVKFKCLTFYQQAGGGLRLKGILVICLITLRQIKFFRSAIGEKLVAAQQLSSSVGGSFNKILVGSTNVLIYIC